MKELMLKPETLPFPYFLVDHKLDIMVAKCVKYTFPCATNFLDIVGLESRKRAKENIVATPSSEKIQLNLKTSANTLTWFDVYVHYESPTCIHLFCIGKDSQEKDSYSPTAGATESDCEIIDMNYALLEEKVSLEHTIEQIQEAAIANDNLATVGKLAASIAHEIRNPLTSVRGFVQLLKPHLVGIGKEHYADIAISELDRANDIIYELLHTSKPTMPLLEEVSIVQVVEEVILLCQSEFILNDCQFRYERPPTDSSLLIDVKQIKQVLLNIFKNAIDAIKDSKNNKSGIIHIVIQQTEDSVIVKISDNGSGMNKETMDQIFTPFYTTKKHGTGVGLEVCKRIVEDHEGQINVASKLEVGSSFNILLPIR